MELTDDRSLFPLSRCTYVACEAWANVQLFVYFISSFDGRYVTHMSS